jgi:hypothetical protein
MLVDVVAADSKLGFLNRASGARACDPQHVCAINRVVVSKNSIRNRCRHIILN